MSSKLLRPTLATVLAAIAAFAGSAMAEPFFTMNYSSAASPNAGMIAKDQKPEYTRSRIAGAGPAGQDVYELVQRYAADVGSFHGGQFSWGWSSEIEAADPAQGSKRYYRWRMRFSPDTNFSGLNWSDGSPSGMQNKLLIVGNGCGSRCRFILTYQAASGRVNNFRIQLDGGADLADTGAYPVAQWLNIQVELDSSSTPSTADGGYKIWINNDNYGAPTAQRVGITLNPTNWKNVLFGGFMNDGLQSSGVHTYRQTDFEADTAFDASWNSGDSGKTPLPPDNVTVE